MTPSSTDRVKEMAEELRTRRIQLAGYLESVKAHGHKFTSDAAQAYCVANLERLLAAQDLAIRMAEAAAANPRGYATWFKLTMGVEF